VITTDTTSTAMLETPALALVEDAPAATTTAPEPAPAGEGPFYAQLLSTSEAKTAEALAARLIENGFTSAYVDRFISEQGTVFRVRVRYPTEAAARAAADQLKTYSRGDVWITRQ
jgi:cell division septation protein DedD